jgi:regulator of protease activity HflC (stomatin/prohibitin superfamily)
MFLDPTLSFGAIAALICVALFVSSRRHVFLVQEGFIGVLFHQGRLVNTLPAGRHVCWGREFRVVTVEGRRTQMQVPGQDVLTADNVTVKLSLVVTTQIVDAARAFQVADNHFTHVYTAAQTALRAATAAVTMDALLNQRAAIGGQVLELIAPKGEAVGVKIHEVEVRDVMLPGDLRKAFSEVLKAKQEAQTALERARGESAAIRNLANAARVVEDLPSLATLRFLQTLESSRAGQTFVMNDLSALLPVMRSRGTAQPDADAAEA